MGLKSFIVLCLSISAAPAAALQRSNLPPRHIFCLYINPAKNRHTDLSEGYREAKAKELRDRALQYVVDKGLHLDSYRFEINTAQCGAESVTLEVSQYVALRLRGFLKDEDVSIHKVKVPKIYLPETPEVRDQVAHEGNRILREMAHSILEKRSFDEFRRIRMNYSSWLSQFWGDRKYATPKLVSPADLDSFNNEVKALKWAAEQQSKLATFSLPPRRRSPVLNMSVAALEELKKELPQLSKMLSEEQELSGAPARIVEPWRLEKRIKFVDDALSVGIFWIGSSSDFNTETYEALAAVLLRTLDQLALLKDESGNQVVTDFEIADALNRRLAIWRGLHHIQHEEGDIALRLDHHMQELLIRLIGVRGLASFFKVYLTALLADRTPEFSAPPTRELKEDYWAMSKGVPVSELSDDSEVLVPAWFYGEFESATIAPTVIPITDSLRFIDAWLTKHGYRYQRERQYQTVGALKESFLKARHAQVQEVERCLDVLPSGRGQIDRPAFSR